MDTFVNLDFNFNFINSMDTFVSLDFNSMLIMIDVIRLVFS